MEDDFSLIKQKNINTFVKFDEFSNVNNLQELINKIKEIKTPKHQNINFQGYGKIFPSIKNDNKTHLLLCRSAAW